jgi:hypothetical protein
MDSARGAWICQKTPDIVVVFLLILRFAQISKSLILLIEEDLSTKSLTASPYQSGDETENSE